MLIRPIRMLFWTTLALSLTVSSVVMAAPTKAQREKAAPAAALMRKAASLFIQKKYRESAAAVTEVQKMVGELTADGDAEMIKLLEPVYTRLKNAHPLLELEGFKLPPLKIPTAGDKPSTTTPKSDGTSFVKQVAPILVSKCGRCHVQKASGQFSMANFAALKKGSKDGVVFFAGDATGSRIIEVIAEGDMPRGGGKLTAAEFATLKQWINEGAKFDGENAETNLAQLAPGSAPMEVAKLEVTQATGKETVSFARDIAPVLVASCNGCHVNPPRRASGRLNMTTFQQLLRGGESGAPIVPGKPAESLLIGKLKGTANGNRMPAGGRKPLADTVIAKIEKWISEGATFDGPEPNDSLETVAALAKAQMSSHDELSADRAEKAAEFWRLAMPNIENATVETENFLLIGNVGENTLADFGKSAEAIAPKVAQMFHAISNQPLIKGRMTLFFFKLPYDYSEFGKMVEKRAIPRGARGHWKYSVVDAYGALVPSRTDEYSTEALIAQQLAGTYVASLGKMPPRWFSEGSARVAASRLSEDDSRVAAWDEQIPKIVGEMKKADDFLTGKLPPETADVASYSYVDFLMSKSKQYTKLLNGLRKGEDFNKTFSDAYGGSPGQVADYWARSAANAKPKRRSTSRTR